MQRTIELVVRESGSSWPEWLNQSGGDDRVVISGDDEGGGGPESDLAFRVVRLLARTMREGKRVRRAVVLVGSGSENPLFDARRMLSRALVSHMTPDAGAELLFYAEGTAELQQKLLSLVGALSDLLVGTHIDVGLRFIPTGPEENAPSGVRSCTPPQPRRLRFMA